MRFAESIAAVGETGVLAAIWVVQSVLRLKVVRVVEFSANFFFPPCLGPLEQHRYRPNAAKHCQSLAGGCPIQRSAGGLSGDPSLEFSGQGRVLL